MEVGSPEFWVALLQIIGINIVLSGDNAVVIALACRSLPPAQQKKVIFWGSMAAIVMRVILTVAAVELLKTPYLKIIGAVLLLWIGVKLLVPEDEHGEGHEAHSSLRDAIKTILIADLVMSLDNVIAVAAAAKGSLVLLIAGLLISIPLVIFGSAMLLKVMERYPIIITIGGMILGYVAGEMIIGDPILKDWVDTNAAWLHYAAPIGGALLVLLIGKLMARRTHLAPQEHVPDLVTEVEQSTPPAGVLPGQPVGAGGGLNK